MHLGVRTLTRVAAFAYVKAALIFKNEHLDQMYIQRKRGCLQAQTCIERLPKLCSFMKLFSLFSFMAHLL